MSFDKAWEFTKRWEGGYVNDAADPGGETNFGISKRAYPKLNIKNLTEEDAKRIYKRDYWDFFNLDVVTNGRFATVVFDTAVNCGVARTAVWLDGCKDEADLIHCRRLHYKSIIEKNPKLKKFAKGWENRVTALEKYIQKLT